MKFKIGDILIRSDNTSGYGEIGKNTAVIGKITQCTVGCCNDNAYYELLCKDGKLVGYCHVEEHFKIVNTNFTDF